LQLVEADHSVHPDAATGLYGAGLGGYYTLGENLLQIRCRWRGRNSRCNS
jgi:hypothetical protein